MDGTLAQLLQELFAKDQIVQALTAKLAEMQRELESLKAEPGGKTKNR